MTAEEFRAVPIGGIVITTYPKARGVMKGVFSATVTGHSLRKLKKIREKVFTIQLRWHYVRPSLNPEDGSLCLINDQIICPTCREVIEVRLPNESEKKGHLARVMRDKGRDIKIWNQF